MYFLIFFCGGGWLGWGGGKVGGFWGGGVSRQVVEGEEGLENTFQFTCNHYRVLHHLLKKLMLIRSDFPHCENLSILTDFIFYDKFSDNDDNRLSRLRSLQYVSILYINNCWELNYNYRDFNIHIITRELQLLKMVYVNLF